MISLKKCIELFESMILYVEFYLCSKSSLNGSKNIKTQAETEIFLTLKNYEQILFVNNSKEDINVVI